MKIFVIKIADEDMDGGFLLLTPKGAGSVNGSGECNFNLDWPPLKYHFCLVCEGQKYNYMSMELGVVSDFNLDWAPLKCHFV